MINFIRKKYQLPTKNTANPADLQLVSTQSKPITFNQLLEKHRGKVLYIDFWSSDCLPCLKQFEAAKALKTAYKDKELVQIYLSIDSDKKAWLKACQKFDLNQDSYFVKNKHVSKQLAALNVHYIPHYLIYDKAGKLVNAFAPNPTKRDLRKLLDGYLGEEI